MKSSILFTVGIAVSAAQAKPVSKRAITDADILNYALTLEHLEATFYAEGLQNYTHSDFLNAGFADPFYENLMKVASDEKEHVSFLTGALQGMIIIPNWSHLTNTHCTAAGAPATAACTYSFPATDVESFLALANVLEGVGVSAYLGAAASIANKEYLTDAGSILTVEARHSSYLRAVAGEVPFAQPFDNPLDFDEVYTLASAFIVSCPSDNPALPVKAFPSLTAVTNSTLVTGSKVFLATGQGFATTGPVHAAFITVTGPIWATVSPAEGGFFVTIPGGIAGQSYVVLSSSNEKVSDETVLAGPAILEIGAKNGRLSTGCTANHSTTSGNSPGQSIVPSQSGQALAPSQTIQYGHSATPSAGSLFTGAASNVQPTFSLLAFIGVMAFL